MDKLFRVEVLNQSLDPQQLIYAAMHQDYCEDFVFDDLEWISSYSTASFYADKDGLNERKAGDLVLKNLLAGGRGHYGPLEHPQITFNIGWFPHSCMQQVRTHRVGVSFDCQSFRYTGARIEQLGKSIVYQCGTDYSPGVSPEIDQRIESVFYLRPLGSYTSRNGQSYEYMIIDRNADLIRCANAATLYAAKIESGFSEEHARSLIPFDTRQHWVMSANVRSLMHLLDLRAKADAQLECQQLCDLIWPHFEAWVPAISQWYRANRWAKARLAP